MNPAYTATTHPLACLATVPPASRTGPTRFTGHHSHAAARAGRDSTTGSECLHASPHATTARRAYAMGSTGLRESAAPRNSVGRQSPPEPRTRDGHDGGHIEPPQQRYNHGPDDAFRHALFTMPVLGMPP